MFDALANADRPLSPNEIAGAVGEQSPMVAHSVLKDLRSRGIRVHRYRDPHGESPAASVYSLRPVDGLDEIIAPVRRRAARVSSVAPAGVRPNVRQPQVGSVVRLISVALDGDALMGSFECDGVVYRGTVGTGQPIVGEWMTLVTVGLHGLGLYVDLAGVRAVTLEDIVEVDHGSS